MTHDAAKGLRKYFALETDEAQDAIDQARMLNAGRKPVYLAADVDAALDAREREVWEKAAVMVEQDCFGDVSVEFDGITKEQYAHNLNQIELARKIRQQGTI